MCNKLLGQIRRLFKKVLDSLCKTYLSIAKLNQPQQNSPIDFEGILLLFSKILGDKQVEYLQSRH